MGLKERAKYLILASFATIGFSAFAATEPEAVPGEYIVKMKTPVSFEKSAVNVLSARLGASIKSVMPEHNLVVIKRASFESTKSVLKSVGNNSMVEYVEPNYIYRINKTPNDPMFGQLWGMSNAKTAGVDISALKAWDIETGNRDIIVASIDTGVNYNHPDLKENMWVNEAEANGKAGIDDDGNGVIDDVYGYNAIDDSGNPLDDHGHGSHTSGTIGARGDDGKGIVGVAWNVRLMGVKFLSANGSGSLEGAIKAIDYATKMGAKIMSNSWGGGGFSQALLESIQRANDAGILFVAAAGNESNNNDSSPTYPATYDVPNVLTVAAVDDEGKMASFSNYGRLKVHVAAPGVNIYSSITGGEYDSWSGTSMATPHVSGIAALVMSHEPNLSAIEVRNRIIATAKPMSSLRGRVRSGGMADAYLALTNVTAPPDENDPANWTNSAAVSASSPHPYESNFNATYTVSVPGAKQIALYFSKFDTEAKYDVVTIKDSTGKIVDQLSGNLDESYSSVIDGESATIEFTTDNSINKTGFDITKAAWR